MRLHEIPRAGATGSSPASPILPAPAAGGYSCPSAGTHPTRAFAGIPVHFCRHPHPARASVGISIRFSGIPHPTRAFAGIPMHFCRPPPPRPRLRRSSPAPSWGRGPCVAIPGGKPCPGCSRRATVSGFSPGSPRALDRGDIAIGGGADGEGERVPPPLSLTLPELRISHRPHLSSL